MHYHFKASYAFIFYRRNCLVVLIIFLAPLVSFAQESSNTWFNKQLATADSIKTVSPSKSLLLYHKILSSIEGPNDSLTVVLYMKLGSYHKDYATLDSASFYFERAVELGQQTKSDFMVVRSRKLYGESLELQGDLEGAMVVLQEALEIAEQKDYLLEEELDVSIAMSYVLMTGGYYDKALDRLYQAKKTSIFSEYEMISRLINHAIGFAYMDSDRLDSAMHYFRKSVKELDEENNRERYAKYYNNMGICLEEQAEYAEAEQMYLNGLKISKELDATNLIAIHYANISSNYDRWDKPQKASEYALMGLEFAKNIGNKSYQRVFTSTLKNAYEALGEYQEAFKYLEEEYALQLSILDTEKQKRLIDVETKFQTEKKDQQLKLQEAAITQQTTQRNALIVGLGLLGIISFLIYRSQRIKVKTNQQLREVEELKNRWFINVSHELKTPLTLVQGPMSQLMESESINEVDRKRIKLANRNLRNLQGLVSEIMDLSRQEEGQLKLNPTPVDLSSMVKSTVASFESLAKVNKVTLEENATENCWMELDEGKMRKLIENLVSNALKFTHEGERVDVSLMQEDGKVKVTVKDTGVGISEEDLPHVFDRFYQSKVKTKSRQGGTGVGLSLAKEVAEMHGGVLKVTSKEGVGSTFVLSLPNSLLTKPVQKETREIEEQTEAPIQIKYVSKLKEKPHLLLVEDNADMRIYIEDTLKSDYQLTVARDGKDALDKLRDATFDLIISDVMMPRMDGIELMKEVKKHSEWSKLPFIALTALNSEEEKLQALRTGIDDYMTKPFSAEELRVRTSNLVQNSHSRLQEPSDKKEDQAFDDELLRELEETVKIHLNSNLLSVNLLADKVSMTERSLQRYLKKQTGLSPTEFILEIKLQRALHSLESRKFATLKEVAMDAGFDRTGRFSTAFEKRFGKRPAEYM